MEQQTKKAGSLVMAAVYDSAVGVYFQPFFARSRAEALRSFSDVANKAGHPFHSHPGDYTLFILATWDEETGRLVQPDSFDCLGTALEHQSRSEPPDQTDLVEIGARSA